MESPAKPVVYEFGEFQLDTSHRRIVHTSSGAQLLTPRLYQILVALLESPGEIVAKEELIARVWKGQFVEEGNLSRNISTLRKRLGEDPLNPQYIDTIARVGYRFIAPVRARPVSAPACLQFSPRRTVGRHAEYLVFKAAFDRLEAGMGSTLAITGEAGIGKTTFVLDSLHHVVDAGFTFHLARGRSSEWLAGTEAFLPFLEALQDLLHGPKGSFTKDTLRCAAPNWYRYLHSSETADFKPSGQRLSVADPQLLKLELNTFLHEITKDVSLVLFLDDVHWADLSTVDLLSYLVAKVSAFRLLVVLAYRPSELHLTNHPLTKIHLDWKSRGVYRELCLDFLTVEDVGEYINLQYPENDFPPTFTVFVQSRTTGNPFFMCDLLRYMEQRGLIVKDGTHWKLSNDNWNIAGELPESIRAMIERKIGQLGELDHRIMVASSVQGEEFDSAVIARVLEIEDADIESALATLDRIHGFVRLLRERESHDGKPMLRYRFVHIFYRNAFLASIPPTRRAKLRHTVAQALLECEGPRAMIGRALLSLKGHAAGEIDLVYSEARDLCQKVRPALQIYPVVYGLLVYYFSRSEIQDAFRISHQFLRIAKKGQDSVAHVEAHFMHAGTLALMGRYKTAEQHLREVFKRYNPADHHTHATVYLLNPFVGALSYYGITRTIQGFLDEGIARAIEATQHPEEVKHPETLAFALMQLCYVRFLRGEPQEASPCVERLAQVARQHRLFHSTVVADMFGGWVAAETGRLERGLHTVEKAFNTLRDARLLMNQFSTLPVICEVLKRARLVEEAISYINELLTIPREGSYESFWPELWKLKGDFLMLQSENSDVFFAEAEKCFRTAIAIAQKQEAKLYELKGATGLCELYKRQGRRQKARRVLQPVLSWFRDGHETRTLREAKNSLL